jgi:peptidoglycan glycosyltransferase
MKSNIRLLSYFLLGALLLLIVYLTLTPTYLNYIERRVQRGELVSLQDPRSWAFEASVKRGSILDRDGVVLAETVQDGADMSRRYPLGRAAAHVVGYFSPRYGSAGLEAGYAAPLLAMEEADRAQTFFDRLRGRQIQGNDLNLTLKAGLQQLAYQGLAGRKGAVVVLDPRTGAILALASSPSFAPGEIDRDMAGWRQDSSAPLLNRATQGAYPPGSVFKIVTAAAALQAHPGTLERTIQCQGHLAVEGFRLEDNAVHGEVDFNRAMALSCNVAFATLGLETGGADFRRVAESFGMGQGAALGVPYRPGSLAGENELSGTELASSAIGQGQVLVNPLQMALITAAVANGGTIMKPYLVAGVSTPEGRWRDEARPVPWLRPLDAGTAALIAGAMEDVVKSGTGQRAAVRGVRVAGKTGSAQNPGGRTHAWFTGFAPADDPRVVVAVVLENAGSGGSVAAPLAREVITAALPKD